MILDDLRLQMNQSLTPWAKAQGLAVLPPYALEEPPAGIEADVACNLAHLLAKTLKKSPRAIAEELRLHLEGKLPPIEAISVAGAGFLNFRWALGVLQGELRTILKEPLQYGRRPDTANEKVLIEFVSANPTGPLHVGHGRGAALGDSLARIESHVGYQVTREYYINDAGNQVRLLGESLLARVRELQGEPFAMPAEGYQGDYVCELAKEFINRPPSALPAGSQAPAHLPPEGGGERSPGEGELQEAIAFALERIQTNIEQDLAVFGVRFDSWFSEAGLVRKGLVEKQIAILKTKGYIQEYDGAVWFVAPKTSSPAVVGGGPMEPPPPAGGNDDPFQDKNRVLKRKDGRWTYFATDIAYHADKYERGYHRLIDVWGADHHGYVPRVKGSMQALGNDPDKLHIILNQLVSLTRNGVPVAMSKRSGEFITLRDVVEEVGKDACRFFFALRGPNTALDFDLELAKKQTVDNPVYYLQYAHARICSIFRGAQAHNSGSAVTAGTAVTADPPLRPDSRYGGPVYTENLVLLKEKEERELMLRLSMFPQVLLVCEREDSPHPLANYLLLLARQFHHFYDHHRVLGEDPHLTQARLGLIGAVRQLLKLGLSLLGVGAPESM